ncbi:MAG: alanine--tRNA ligase [Acidobacteriia bacterium]|nr:alanine--tRNA ligase [Terriglobia bacterium]
MKSSDIRNRFLKFFEERGHRVVRSSPLVPANDPTLLFSNAGMNQFKDVFLGLEKRDYARACSSQKCVRAGGKHNDLEQVGRTTRHHTFFEMLGNFSFGDYFKKDAIAWAWELVTSPDWFAIPKDKLYVTIFEGATIPHADIPRDDEAHQHWLAQGVARERIFEFGMKENFWQMGDTGPCGPCSEIHYDMGPAASDLGHTDCKFPCDCGRYVEIWNLVFMQYDRKAGVKDGVAWYEFSLLPKPCVDTGMGLERVAAVLQGKISNYDTDLFRPLIQEAAGLANVEYGANRDTDVSLRIIADHARAATFLISDGVLPSNEGRGYVLRLIMRRALYHGQTLGLNEPFLFKMAGHVVQMMKDAYPELVEHEHHTTKAIKIEEEKYAHTVRLGMEKLEEALVILENGDSMRFRDWKSHFATHGNKIDMIPLPPDYKPLDGTPPKGVKWISGDDLFELHDTFGLRPDFVEDIVKNYGLGVDWESYKLAMWEQRERARASWKGAEKKTASPVYLEVAEEQRTVFDGYKQVRSEGCMIVALIGNGQIVNEVKSGEEAEIVLDHTPFYAEAGGQVGDVGHLLSPMQSIGAVEVAHIRDTYFPVAGVIAHKAVARETIRAGDMVTAVVDVERRDAIRRNHTATHLLHAALRKTLGTHVKQAGSLVAPDRLRFDFTHYAAVDEQDLLDIEDLVNERVLANEEVSTNVMDLDSAVNAGAMALFGEKYADRVRVVSVNDFSKELCGGTHVRRTGDIGLFKIVSESSVAAGTRRIEAVTGTGVLKQLREASETLSLLSQSLRAKPDELLQAAEKLTEAERKLRKELEAQQMKRAASQAGDLVEQAKDVKGVRVIAAHVEALDRAAMRQMVDNLRPKLGSGVIVLGSVANGNVALVAAVTKDLTGKLDAGKIVREAAKIVEGSGGGRKDLAEAGGKNPEKLEESLRAVPAIVEKML